MELTSTWADWYRGDAQGLYALLVVPMLFLVYLSFVGPRGAGAGARRFIFVYCFVFTLETLLDPIATGVLVRGAGPTATTAVGLLFVLLGDFRVFLLTFRCSGNFGGRESVIRAAAFTPVVPLIAYGVNAALDAGIGPLSGQVLWLTHELLFAALALWLLSRYGNDPFLRRCLLFVVSYYALWASADVLILLGVDLGWLLRAVPNQLYYSFWTPFVWLTARTHPPSVFR